MVEIFQHFRKSVDLRLFPFLIIVLSCSLHGSETESVQIGSEKRLITVEAPRRIWPPTADLLNQPLEEFHSKYTANWSGRSLHDYFDLCKEILNRPCSFEANDEEQDVWTSTNSAPINLAKTTPAKVLDAILQPYPGYHWVIRDDVINIEPAKLAKDDVLSRKIDHLRVDQISSLQASIAALNKAKVRWAWQGVNGTEHGTFSRISMDLNNIALRDALNAIAREDGQIMWEFSTSRRSWKKLRDGTLFMPSYRKNGVSENLGE